MTIACFICAVNWCATVLGKTAKNVLLKIKAVIWTNIDLIGIKNNF